MSVKKYDYKTIVIEDRGFINDPVYLHALNAEGAFGWRHKEEQIVGSRKLAVLLERETIVDNYEQEELPDSGPSTVSTLVVEDGRLAVESVEGGDDVKITP